MKKDLYKVLIAAALFAAALLCPSPVDYVLFAAAYLVAGAAVIRDAMMKILHGELLDEDFLMTLATWGAIALGEFTEAVGVMLFFQIGELFEHYAVNRSRTSIASLMEIRPDSATVLRDGEALEVDPDEVEVGELIRVAPGDRVPLDAVITEGTSTLDTAALTGESLPREVGVGDELLSGCINRTGLLTARVTKPSDESTVSRILDLVENAAIRKSRQESFITKFARVYTPSVVGAALLLAFVPPLFFHQSFAVYLQRALMFLVVSCPCALVISVPLAYFGGIGGASKRGILVKGGSCMEILAKANIAVFDKTGTLTQGKFALKEVQPAEGVDPDELIRLAAHAESTSTHPIAQSIVRAYKGQLAPVSEVQELAGFGVSAKALGRTILAGSRKLMLENKLDCPDSDAAGSVVYVAADGQYLGLLVVADLPKADARDAIRALKAAGVEKTVMLTGDRRSAADAIGAQLGLDEVRSELLPEDKVQIFESYMGKKNKVLYAGDGINDAPVLARADVGIAMGALGSDAAIEAADVVIMTDQPSKIAESVQISRKVLGISKQNIIFALAVKGAVLLLSALGRSNMWLAIFSDVGVAVLCILNSMRCLR